ncbi:hypothetical protein [Vibrio harveyi]|uniref:hypothetical protein n=1 Tax=Vibrio harveyi TaxID=669 RepID=UPI00390AB61C
MNVDTTIIHKLLNSARAFANTYPEVADTCQLQGTSPLDLLLSYAEDIFSISTLAEATETSQGITIDVPKVLEALAIKNDEWTTAYHRARDQIERSKALQPLANELFGVDPKIAEVRWTGITDDFAADVATLYIICRYVGASTLRDVAVNCPEVCCMFVDDYPPEKTKEFFQNTIVPSMNQDLHSHMAVEVGDSVQLIPIHQTTH